jgi:cobalt-zinc-cadmium resistance protein CzcA
VEGIVVMRKGENPRETLERLKAKIADLNERILPKDVKLETIYDRDVLMDYTTSTVMHNVLEGIILVTVIVFLFMAEWRTTLIVSIVIPLSLLFAFLCLNLMGMSANLLSLGAIDFGIIIDGAVVMVEGIFVALAELAHTKGMQRFNHLAKGGLFRKTGSELGKAIFFSKLIIITALIPIFSFQKVEGKMFSPLAFTLGFALLGALIFTLTLIPVLSHLLLNKNVRERHNPFVLMWNNAIERSLTWTFAHKRKSLAVAMLLLLMALFSTKFLGSEFLPQLNEGALWINAKLPMSTSLDESVKMMSTLRAEIRTFDEVQDVLSQSGRSNDGTDPNGFYYSQLLVNLKPKEQWKRKITMEQLIDEIDTRLRHYQGIVYNYSQPVIDNVAEAVAGFKANNGIKVFGSDLNKLDNIASNIIKQIETVPGIKDVGILRNIGQPEVSVELDRQKMALYGVTLSDAQSVLEMAFGGKTATEKYEGERKFGVRIRYEKQFRKDEEDIADLKVSALNGSMIPLREISTIKKVSGPAFIYRDNMKQYIGIKFSIRDRDLGSTIAEAQENVRRNIQLPAGYEIGWTGEFENQIRATDRLIHVVPISIVLIFIILFMTFGNIKDASLVLINVPFALIGGIAALHITGINFIGRCRIYCTLWYLYTKRRTSCITIS